MEDLRKALNKIAEQNSLGNVSDDILIKAHESYIHKTGFEDDYTYNVFISKSVFDFINGVKQDEEILKAILPGATKMIDGVLYVYTATPNAQTPFDWRVVKKGSKTNAKVGRGDTLDDAKIKAKQKYINQLFPKDLSSLKTIKTLGGSTGAILVEDVNGNQYVLKRGSNTNNFHVQSEYLANQLYDAMGLRVPDYELYDDNGDNVLLSKYIPMTREPQMSDFPAMAKGIIADVLLANWDVYKNDNCLIDSANRVIRVDNGGCLYYRAQGNQKAFDEDVVKTFTDLKKYNPMIFAQVSDEDIIDQIKTISEKKDDVVNYLKENGDQLADVMEKRFDNLSKIESFLQQQIALKNPTILPRNLKPANEMYRTFSDIELEDMWNNAEGSSTYGKLHDTASGTGWKLLSTICKERGFDARPRVVDDKEYWDAIAKSKHPQSFRGLTASSHHSAEELVSLFKYGDTCYYGHYGIYGEGIYAHVNDGTGNKDNTKLGYMKSDAYKHAKGQYSGGSDDGVLLLGFEDNTKIAKVDDVIAAIKKNPPISINTAAAKAVKLEVDDLQKEIDSTTDDLSNISNKTIEDVYDKMHYNHAAIMDMQLVIDGTDWGEVDDEGQPAYPSWTDFVEGNMTNWVQSNGGTVTQFKGRIVFKLPNSIEEFSLNKYTYENNAIKQKNSFTKPYSYPVERFQNWVMSEHVSRVEKAKNEAVENLGDMVTTLKTKIQNLKIQFNDKTDEMNKLSNPNPDADIYSAIYDNVSKQRDVESVGIYAALKGIDVLFQPNGNGTSNGFYVILNRSKVIVKK